MNVDLSSREKSKELPAQINEETVRSLIDRYNTPVPRYTSYPTALEFDPAFDENIFLSSLEKMDGEKPVSLYIHIPFCEVRCYYCGCNVIVSRRKEMLPAFLNDLFEEIRFKTDKAGFRPRVSQLHFGGGTPNYLSQEDWAAVIAFLKERFQFEPGMEQSVELDPMHLSVEYIEGLKNLGFNRLSFGIQDIHENIQETVNRKQSLAHIEQCYNKARELGFESLNVDFIYGLPYQNRENFNENMDWVEKFKPDRIAIFSYAHIPWIKSHQKNMPEQSLPSASEKMSMYLSSRKRLLEMGYVAIGMDHYALPQDELSRALGDRSLHRNFMGYTTKPNIDMLAFGPSAISMVGGVFAQNHVKLRAYENSCREKNGLFEKGYNMTSEDRERSDIIQSIMNNLFVNIQDVEKERGMEFWKKYSAEKLKMEQFEREGLVHVGEKSIEVTPAGSYVVRHIAQVFDAYRKDPREKRFSKGI